MPISTDLLDLRPVTAADQPFLNRLYRSSRDDLSALGDDANLLALIELQQNIQEQGQRAHFPNAQPLLLWHHAHPVARLVLDSTPERVHIVDITVLAEQRGQGLGTALLQWAQHRAREASVALELNVQRHNIHAQRLYHSLGFQTVTASELSDHMRWQA